jgi:hypothetical protein
MDYRFFSLVSLLAAVWVDSYDPHLRYLIYEIEMQDNE